MFFLCPFFFRLEVLNLWGLFFVSKHMYKTSTYNTHPLTIWWLGYKCDSSCIPLGRGVDETKRKETYLWSLASLFKTHREGQLQQLFRVGPTLSSLYMCVLCMYASIYWLVIIKYGSFLSLSLERHSLRLWYSYACIHTHTGNYISTPPFVDSFMVIFSV
jgi:hypothetical protein